MKRILIQIMAVAIIVAAGNFASTATAAGNESFDVISNHNIFDTTRGAKEIIAPHPIERFTLVGTMSYEKGRFAFFDSENVEFRKALKVSDMIAGYQIAEIGRDGVTLEADKQSIVLRVGSEMKLQP